MKGTRTALTKADSGSASLRSTVPQFIVKNFELEDGDSLYWHLDTKDGKTVIIIEIPDA